MIAGSLRRSRMKIPPLPIATRCTAASGSRGGESVSQEGRVPVSKDCIESSSSVSVGDDSDVSSVIIKRAFDGSQDQSLGEEVRGLQSRKKSLSLPTVHLPVELQAALDNVVSKYARWSVVRDGEAMSKYLMIRNSKRVREKNENENSRITPDTLWDGESKKPKKGHFETVLRYGKREAVAFAASRIQASYGTAKRVLSEIATREPSFKPETVLDFGSGLGTVPWAVHQLWGGSVYEYQCADISQWMSDMARTLRSGGQGEEDGVDTSSQSIPGVYSKQYLPVSNKLASKLYPPLTIDIVVNLCHVLQAKTLEYQLDSTQK